MESFTYQELIENKISEWRDNVDKLKERTPKTGSSEQQKINQMVNELSKAVEEAGTQLRQLEKQENATNTMEIKEKILQIFESIDRNLATYKETTPYML